MTSWQPGPLAVLVGEDEHASDAPPGEDLVGRGDLRARRHARRRARSTRLLTGLAPTPAGAASRTRYEMKGRAHVSNR